MKQATRILAISCLLLCAVLGSLNAQSGKSFVRQLQAGGTVNGRINLGPNAPNYQTFRIEVPESAVAIHLRLDGALADLDLYIKHGEEIVSYDDVCASAASDDHNEALSLSRLQDPPLRSGLYYVDVSYQLGTQPRHEGRLLNSLSFSLAYEVVLAEPVAGLVPGTAIRDSLKPEEAMVKLFWLDLPPGTRVFRVDLFDVYGDLDLLVNFGTPAFSPKEADRFSSWVTSRESLVWQDFPEEPLRPGRYYITVLDQLSDDHPEAFSIVASLSPEVPEFLHHLPPMPSPQEGLERAILATMELITADSSGSGCLVSPRGLVLTNWHVIRGPSGRPADTIYGAVSLDPNRPPQELFRLRVLAYDQARDLAILRVEGGFHGQALPADYRFPYYRLATAPGLRIGQPLLVLGYPGIGGTGSRSSITLTSGIVSGFQRSPFGNLIKTDAEINSGNSGGAAMDSDYRLIGLPTMVVNQDAGQLGFIHPLSFLPAEWLAWIATDSGP